MAKAPQTAGLRERHTAATEALEEAKGLARSFEADIRAEESAAAQHRARLIKVFGAGAVGDAKEPSELAELAKKLGDDARARAERLIDRAQTDADKLVADLKAAASGGGADADAEEE